MDQRILTQTARDFAELDLTEDRARLAELQAEHQQLSGALARADQRIAEIRQELMGFREPDRKAVADALLAGIDAREASHVGSTEDELRAELETLNAGRHELRHREEDKRSEINRARAAAGQKARLAADPLAELLHGEMVETAQRLVDIWASLSALKDAACGTTVSLREGDRAAEAILSGDGLIGQRAVEVPADIQEVISNLHDKRDILRSLFVTTVHAPTSLPFLR